MNNLQEYSKYLQEQNLAIGTIENYPLVISRYYDEQPLAQENITEFIKRLVKKLEPGTIWKYRNILASYARFLKIEIDWKRITKLIPQQVKKLFPTITLEELEQLKKARIEKNNKIYERNNLIFDFLFYSGLRISELMKIKHSDWNDNSLRVLGKGNKVRYVLLTPDLVKHLNSQKKGYLFVSRSGETISDFAIRETLRRRIKKAGIKKQVSPHTFRRSFATLLHNKGCNYLYQDYSKILKEEKALAN